MNRYKHSPAVLGPRWGNGAGFAGMACLACLVSSSVRASVAEYSPPPFETYQLILDRMPFGALPANFNAAPVDAETLKSEQQVKAEQQKLAKQVNMSAVNITPDGATAIGFTDLSQKPPLNYYLLVGESSDGWKVVSADYDTEVATLEKEGVTITLQLGKGMVDAAAVAGKGLPPEAIPGVSHAVGRRAQPGLRGDESGIRSRHGTRGGVSVRGGAASRPLRVQGDGAGIEATMSYADRLRARADQQKMKQLAEAAKMKEQLEKIARDAATQEIQRREEESLLAVQQGLGVEQQPGEQAPTGVPEEEPVAPNP